MMALQHACFNSVVIKHVWYTDPPMPAKMDGGYEGLLPALQHPPIAHGS